MRVVVPYVLGRLEPATLRAVVSWPGGVDLVRLPAEDRGAYARLVRSLWSAGEGFMVCEQDIVPTRAQLLELATCHARWCSFLYDADHYPDGPMMGLCKFSTPLLRAHPHAADVALIVGRRRDADAEWWNVDNRMARDLSIRHVPWCCHDSRVRHLHPGGPFRPPEPARA